MFPGKYRIVAGSFAGAVVNFYFFNASGFADCRFAEDFGPHRKGEIVCVKSQNLEPIEDQTGG